jgi:DNA-binding MarR family transcriptional regulator
MERQASISEDLQGNLVHLVRRGYSLITEVLQPTFVARGFTFTQFVIMTLIRDERADCGKDISALCRHDSGALSRTIEQLVRRGLIERTRSHHDRRVVQLRLTTLGKRAVEELIALKVLRLNLVLDGFTSQEVRDLIHKLIKLNAALCSIASTPNSVRQRPSGPHLSEGRFQESMPQEILWGAEIPGQGR